MNQFLILIFAVTFASNSYGENSNLIEKIVNEHQLDLAKALEISRLLTSSRSTRNIGTEDPEALFGPHQSVHPVSRLTCRKAVLDSGLIQANPIYEKICGAKWMSPIPGANGNFNGAKVCIDQFEFPNIPCEYPLAWTSAAFAHRMCRAMGKRVCNSHEWEGACAGRTEVPNPYRFDISDLAQRQKATHRSREQVWAFSWNRKARELNTEDLCAVFNPQDPSWDLEIRKQIKSHFTPIGQSLSCSKKGGDAKSCGTNTLPSGFKALCRTQNDVFDLHGNLTEVVNFPLTPEGLARDSKTDRVEKKGSSFLAQFDQADDCRARHFVQPTKRLATDIEASPQQGFRCCKDVDDN